MRHYRVKDQQLCQQAAEALDMAFASIPACVEADLTVVSVLPVPNAANLQVMVKGAEHLGVEQVQEVCDRFSSQLRAEVAESVNRKRAPVITLKAVLPKAAGLEQDPWE